MPSSFARHDGTAIAICHSPRAPIRVAKGSDCPLSSRALLRASCDRRTKRQQERLRAAFTAHEAHISVEVAYHCAQQVRDVFHQDTPAQGRRLAARLVERLPTCPIPEIARLGRTLRKWKDAFLAYFDTAGASNGPTEAINGHYRARQTHRQRLPQPHQLPAPNAPHRRRPRCLHPHSTLKSRTTPPTRAPYRHISLTPFDKAIRIYVKRNVDDPKLTPASKRHYN